MNSDGYLAGTAMKILGLATACGMALVACGGAAEVDSVEAARSELAMAEGARDEALDRVAELEVAVKGFEVDLTASDAQSDELMQRAEVAEAAVDTLTEDLEAAAAQVEAADDDAEAAKAEVERLKLQYDPEIRAELQGEVDLEIGRSCNSAIENWTLAYTRIVQYDTAWDAITSKGEVVAAVEACAEPERSKSVEEREAERLAACESIEVDQLEKNPAAYKGTCVVMYAMIVQFDAATGPCAFHAELSATRSTRWLSYDVRSTFGYAESALMSSLETDCIELDDIDGDDFIKIWATGLGSYSYDTSLGGTNTVPSFLIEKVELVRKD